VAPSWQVGSARPAEDAGRAQPHAGNGAAATRAASVTPLGPRRESAVPPSPGGPAPPGCLREATDRVARRRREAVDGPDTTTRRSAQGRMTARERIDLLLDDGSFVELGAFARHRATGFGIEHRRPDTDGVVTGWGTVDGRRVCVFAHDPRIFGGALGEVSPPRSRR
jgi:methylmalonyl-CoA decarboxylase subunit alpha